MNFSPSRDSGCSACWTGCRSQIDHSPLRKVTGAFISASTKGEMLGVGKLWANAANISIHDDRPPSGLKTASMSCFCRLRQDAIARYFSSAMVGATSMHVLTDSQCPRSNTVGG